VHGKEKKPTQNLKGRDHFKDLGVEKKVILNK
jgi:hypothetical protein